MSTSPFNLVAPYKPCGDQPRAIEAIVANFGHRVKEQILLGVTGSGKTFTMANVIQALGKPTLVLSHNKTLAAQLYSELKEFFPDNAVEYFVSYYDYYQPEAYIPHTNTYIEKDASINDDLDKLRLKATGSLLSRKDVIIVASVSAIYGLGSPEEWEEMFIQVKTGDTIDRDAFLRQLVGIQYERNDIAVERGKFRVRGEAVDLWPTYSDNLLRLEFFEDTLEKICEVNKDSGREIAQLNATLIFPAKHFVVKNERVDTALQSIKKELAERVRQLQAEGKLLEAERLESRTNYDVEMLMEVGYCSGIENYSRHLSGREAGSRPDTLIDYFRGEFLTIIDESHVTVPQVRGMYNGDRARKETLVAHGFRLPSALDNRPLQFFEFEQALGQVLYVSATPGPYEKKQTPVVVEQIIRPTGLLDPVIEVRSARDQVDDLIAEVRAVALKKERVLVTTLTKRMAEDLSQYLGSLDIKVRYLHSDLDAIERVEILKSLRLGDFDCLVGINLLREGLDLPEVSLVAILEADKEGFLRSEVSLIQTAGRAARHVNGRVIMYADTVTESMQRAISETERRRARQIEYNAKNGIVPQSIRKAIRNGIEQMRAARDIEANAVHERTEDHDITSYVAYLEKRMFEAAQILEFDKAARLRDDILALKKKYPAVFPDATIKKNDKQSRM